MAATAAGIGAAVLGFRPAAAQMTGCTCRDSKDPFNRDVVRCLNDRKTYCGDNQQCAERACAGKKAGDPCSCG
jgi:hypothetical protein